MSAISAKILNKSDFLQQKRINDNSIWKLKNEQSKAYLKLVKPKKCRPKVRLEKSSSCD